LGNCLTSDKILFSHEVYFLNIGHIKVSTPNLMKTATFKKEIANHKKDRDFDFKSNNTN